MKKTLFVASLLACALPVLADAGLTLSGEGIANDCTWNLYATFDKLAYTDTFTTLATVNLNNNAWPAIYAVGYTYIEETQSLTLGMASYANPTDWNTISLGSVTLGADMPVSFALTHNGSNEGGNNTLTLHGATGNTTTNFMVSDNEATSAKADKYSNKHISSVSLGTAATSTRIFNQDLVLTPATGTNVNLVGARLEHEAYSKIAFEEFVLEEKPFAADEVVRYTTVEQGNQKNVYSYGTENGEVTFNPDKFPDNKLTLKETIDLTARTTFIVDEGKIVEINGANEFTGADKRQHEKGSVFGGGELVKSGDGTLKIRLNDTNRNIETTEFNDFYGNVTVEEGTLSVFHSDVNPSAYKARLGGGADENGSVIIVKEGATLELGAQTEISIPLGAHASKEANAHNIVIDGGAVHVYADKEYNIPKDYTTETSTIKNAVITREGIHQVDPEVRAQLIVAGVTVYDDRPADQVVFEHADILADDVHFNGHTIIRNTNLFADEQLIASSLGTNSTYSLEVVEGSHVVYGAGADERSSGTWGHVDNVYVDQTSKLQTAKNLLDKHWGGHLYIQGTCKLDIADKDLKGDTGSGSDTTPDTIPDTKPDIGSGLTPDDIVLPSDNAKGLAVRTDGKVQAVYNGAILTLDDISYVTDQLSGDMLYTYNDVPGTLDLHLKDPKDALPDGKTLSNTVFTLTLTNFDSSLLVVDAFGNLDPKAATLTIDAFKDTQWYLVYGRYDAKTNNSIFTFSTMENLHINTPEPATATLSLLALAALAARRKRK